MGRSFAGHHAVNHSRKQFVDKATGAHINTAEAFTGQVERALVGVYHILFPEHLQRYLNEIAWRWNRRELASVVKRNKSARRRWWRRRSRAHGSARTRAQTPALLKGLIFGPTGAAMSSTHTRKGNRLYRYYVSQDVLQHGRDACPIGRVPAAEIEAAVIDQLRGVFRQPEIVIGTWRAARAEADDVAEDEARDALADLDPLWDELFPAD